MMVTQPELAELTGLMPLFYPRIYARAGNYHSPKQLAVALCSAAYTARQGENGAVACKKVYPALQPMASRKMPLFFVGKNFLEAIKQTEFQDEIDWINMPLPFEEGAMVLPLEGFRHPELGDLGYIVWSRVAKDHITPRLSPKFPPLTTMGGPALHICSYYPEHRAWMHTTLEATRNPKTRINNLFCLPSGEIPEGLNENEDRPLTMDDHAAAEKAGTIMFGSFLAIAARPDILTKEVREYPSVKSKAQFWHPNYIGQFYKTENRGGEHPHGSPRLHWRRGHFRNQVCGVGRAARKIIWLEPCLVAAEGV